MSDAAVAITSTAKPGIMCAAVTKTQVGVYSEALSQLGCDMENIIDEESDPGLGNGGLRRLAS